MTDLERFIAESPLADTHEHLRSESDYLTAPRDILCELFENYVPADLAAAGADPKAIERLVDANDPDLEGRFGGVREAWQRVKHTGYGEGVRLIAKLAYGMSDVTLDTIRAHSMNRREGDRLRILRECANIDHVQIDAFTYKVAPDLSGPEFFLYDLNWMQFANGKIDYAAVQDDTGIEIEDIDSLDEAMTAIFDRYGPYAIAVKTQHAYERTLKWTPRTHEEAKNALEVLLTGSDHEATALCLGDWCLERGVELATERGLPIKIHTGYLAGNNNMNPSQLASGLLWSLFARHLNSKFVLMHTAYPYSQELVAMAKHYANVYIDLCWAWSLDPYSTADFVRRVIHAVPSHKLFGFGGDTGWPTSSYAYSMQARRGLAKALQAEVNEGEMSEMEAICLAERFMMDNQEECFRTSEKKAYLKAAAGRS